MKRPITITAAALLAVLGSAALVATTSTAAQAEYWESNSFFCSGPYTQGYGQSRTRNGVVEHWRGNPDTFKGDWTNGSSWTYRYSNYHGSGSQSFIVLGSVQIDSASNTKGCHYIG